MELKHFKCAKMVILYVKFGSSHRKFEFHCMLKLILHGHFTFTCEKI